MSDNPDCPSPDQLHRALTGDLPPDQIVAIEQHLLECGPCAQQTLHSGDLQTYSQALRQSSQAEAEAVPKADAEQLEQLIARLRELPQQQQVTQLSGDQEDSRSADLESELVGYLQPARAAEELGWLGTYRVLKLLGSGGMGGVFLAEDTQLHRRVALKVMRPDISGQVHADERFLREARAAAAVHHDHIVTIFQVGRDGQVPFLAMEFLEGESLEDRLRRERLMPLTEVLRIGREIAEGLAAAHSRGLVHRDIKPANIWLETRGGTVQTDAVNAQPPRVKLLDFGLARAADANFELTSQGMVIGTPAYMAPEQAAGDTVDHRADLFSFGVVLYRLATGALPFQGKDAISTLVSIKSDTPDDPRLRRQDLPQELSDLILRLLKKNPDERPASAAEVAKQLARMALPLPVSEIPANIPTTHYQSKPPSKGALWRILAAFVFLVLLGGVFVIATDRGQVKVVIDSKDKDVDIEVVVTRPDGYFQVFDKQTGSQVKGFWSGKYEVEIKGDANSFVVDKTDFVLKRGKTEILTVTRRPTSEVPANVEPAKNPANVAQSVLVPEPPPLSEWLKGRKVLTVAQDGSGQFKTIQAALDALQPGQVVKVLDRGPYTESLRCTVPRHTGLISDVQTVLEATDWPAKEHAHMIVVIEGFRLNGFRLQARLRPEWFEVLHVTTPSGLVVENCSFGLPVPDPDHAALCSGLQLSFDQYRRALQPVWIRDCLLEKSVGADGPLANGTIVVENNLFRDCGVAMSKVELQTLVVRHNVFENPTLHPTWYGDPVWFGGVSSVKETLEIVNNTASMPSDSRSTGIQFVKALPPNNVVIRNNLSDSNLVMNDELWNGKPNSLELWQVDHNGYSREYRPQMRATTDVVGKFTFLSTDTKNADAWRIAVDSPLAAGGAGGSLPGYIGALPPGPAPQNGDWFTRLRQRWGESPKEASTIPPPIKVAEPPQLAEWLKGRKLRTVAQDGGGEFKTIKAAFDALKPHEVIQILDRGPYREALRMGGLPPDTGLVSQQQTVIEVPAELESKTKGNWGHMLGPLEGFRLSGLRLLSPVGKNVYWGRPSDLVIEDCYFGRTIADKAEMGAAIHLHFDGTETGMKPIVIRNCLFDLGGIEFGDHVPGLLIENNYFKNAFIGGNGPSFGTVLIRNNVIDFSRSPLWIQRLAEVRGVFEISNNTTVGMSKDPLVSFVEGAPGQGVVVRSNISTLLVGLDGESIKVRANALKTWQLDHNSYLRLGAMPKSPSDVMAEPQYLSLDPSHRDYLHIPANGPLASAGPGGAWPSYIGALPPGPAPMEGDWFTRLQDRWSIENVKRPEASAPIKISEPPPLAEWLKGRKVLTVAQDGSGQFKTIQAALDALQPGEAVKVLDKGPYRELLYAPELPPDSGLITEVQTILESPEWKLDFQEDSPTGGRVDVYRGHALNGANGFRWHGFEMRFPPSNGMRVRRCGGARTKNFVLENCFIHTSESESPEGEPIAFVDWHNVNGVGLSLWIRDCVIEGSVVLIGLDKRLPLEPEFRSGVVIEHNLFVGVGTEHHLLMAGESMAKVLIRHNVFAGKSGIDIHLHKLSVSDSLEITNNLLLSPTGVCVLQSALVGAVTIRNNAHTRDGLVSFYQVDGAESRAAAQSWNVDHNAYPAVRAGISLEQVLARPQGDLAVLPRFLSKVPQESDYLRIPADAPLAKAGAGGTWPQYIGALPPGPAPKEGDWFTRLRERSLASPGGVSNKSTSTKHPASGAIASPLPLADWLKGREVLTVAQDGKGQFKSIREALVALKPHQVVRVLDRGPYRELLRLETVADDTGLITDQQTVLEIVDSDSPESKEGHLIGSSKGFRMSGFQILARADQRGISWVKSSGLVVEDCYFGKSHSTNPERAWPVNFSFKDVDLEAEPIHIRHCVFDRMGLEFVGKVHSFVIEHNYFKDAAVILGGPTFNKIEIHHNVFDTEVGAFWFVNLQKVSNGFQIASNTIHGPKPLYIMFNDVAPSEGVTIRNNLSEGGIQLNGVADEVLTIAKKNWRVTRNGYTHPGSFPPPAGDVTSFVNYLSTERSSRSYLRLPLTSPLATPSANDNEPGYIGALPPGPAPVEGDWFTRLRERWPLTEDSRQGTRQPSAPAAIPRVATLTEWLQDRDTVTVAQDGSGQHRTIGAALRALRPKQVVKVLDRGPYKEHLHFAGMPLDTGLITDHQTIIEVEEWKDSHAAHEMGPLNAFRLSGFCFIAPQDSEWRTIMNWIQPNGLVIENCFFGRRPGKLEKPGPEASIRLGFRSGGLDVFPVVIRNCVFDGGSVSVLAQKHPGPTIGLTQNFFRRAYVNLQSEVGTVVVQHNLFESSGPSMFWIENLTKIHNVLEISNNTVAYSAPPEQNSGITFVDDGPMDKVVIRNNITDSGVHCGAPEPRRQLMQRQWLMDHNAYVREWGSFEKSPSDLLLAPAYLSTNPQHPDAWRIAPDSPFAKGGTGGAWPNYIGAFPPGPAPVDGDWFISLRDRWKSFLTTDAR